MSKNYYNLDYFQKRDHLDLHIAESIKILAKDYRLKTVLDVGCGTGRLVKFFNENGLKAYGCDSQDEALKIARKYNNRLVIKKASGTHLPFKNGTFDLITSISVIEHLGKSEVNKFISEAYRVLKNEGFLFIITPNFDSPLRLLQGRSWFGYSDPTHLTFFTPKKLKILLERYNFKNVRFRLKTAYNIPFDYYLPSFTRKLPMPFKNILNYLMISSPLSTFRDSFWTVAQKCSD